MYIHALLLFIAVIPPAASVSISQDPVPKGCRYVLRDQSWPSLSDWAHLNTSVDWQLIATVPLASVSHDPTYDEAACARMQQSWAFSQTHIPDPASIVEPLAQNESCDPFTPRTSPCRLGNYAAYAINVSSPSRATAGLQFAREKNIRLVIKSTRHDLLGKSIGRGSLGLCVQNLHQVSFFTYNSSLYTGPPRKFSLGILAWGIYEAAALVGKRVLAGTCNTVSVAGGFSQAGGHSLLSSTYGLSADNVLEWEVVLPDSSLVVATPNQASDLYWALSGGGGSTYAVVMSMTVKTFPESSIGIGGAAITYTNQGISEDTYWASITAFRNHIPAWVAAGGVFLPLRPLTFPDKTPDEVNNLIAPFTTELDNLAISFVLNITSFPNYLAHFNQYYRSFPSVNGGRLIPRSLITSNRTQDLVDVYRQITASGDFMMIGVCFVVSGPPVAPNGLNPYWRDTIVHNTIQSSWNFTASWENKEVEMLAG
ncbi:FAD-linked oxidoreductase [Lachnellula occidentalis]|uniref:FAD-linked oxidoreductase n=1 Tax=Lachnellula occidentalis TaxID=215460 RepID=A0A8H8RY75_9HELO|nr:FAD-linked oxidoreductase [Lachnellula occidentalis]